MTTPRRHPNVANREEVDAVPMEKGKIGSRPAAWARPRAAS
jgi:hypothetical protein